MTRLEVLTDLRDKVEAGEDVDALILLVQEFDPEDDFWRHGGRTINEGSVDAALKLCEAVLPGWSWQAWANPGVLGGFTAVLDGPEVSTPEIASHCPARALLLATLGALIEKERGDG